MNNTENRYEEFTEETDELLALEQLSNSDTDTEELLALDGDAEDIAETDGEPKAEKSAETLITVVGVRFKNTGKVYYFSPKGMTFENGDSVVVDTSRGIEFGTVCMGNKEMCSKEIVLPIREVLRKATAEDIARRRKNADLEITAFNTFIERIDAHGLEMKLIDVECAFDNSKLLFYFSAESRIDFRELVRELAGIFHTRIELRQIGTRDETKMLGGLGICGRPFCCSDFLSDFVQVSIKMAKEQNLSLNAAKISGACGKLMCCLRYEYDSYLAEKALTPKIGAEVMTPDGEGIVSEANPMTGIVKVKLSGTAEDEAPAVFLRDDLVPKSEYKGEKLTRTPLPTKRNNVAPTSSFEVRSPFADKVEEAAEAVDTKPKSEPKDKKKRENRSRSEGAQATVKTDKTDITESDSSKGSKDKSKNNGTRTEKTDKPDKNSRFGKPGHGKSGKNGDNADVVAVPPQKPTQKGGDQSKTRPQKPFPPKNQGQEKTADSGKQGGKKPHRPFYHKGGNKRGSSGGGASSN